MPSDEIIVRGNAISELCVKHAAMLNLEIYDTPKAKLPEELHPYWDINKSHWELSWGFDDPDGYRVGFYIPKSRPSQDPASICPPVLVFRGSDSEESDFQELAFGYELAIDGLVDAPWPARNIPFAWSKNGSFGLTAALTDKSLAEMRATGLFEETLFINSRGTEQVEIEVPWYANADVDLNWRATVSLFYGVSGDWAVNFAQGLGRNVPPQYIKAIEHGARAAEVAIADWNNRLIITGHSLGGGLASAAAIRALRLNPDLIVKCVTYNAAGLHTNTAREANATLALASEVPVRALHVKDEILNSMQARSRLVPFLADVLEWGDKTMPPAVANPTPHAGISPGAMPITGQSYAPKGERLPILYTVNNQKLGPRLTEMDDIIGIANSATTIQQFVSGLIQHLADRLSAGPNITKAEADTLQELAGNITVRPNFKERFKAAIMEGAAVPQFEFTGSDYARQRVGPFVNAMIQDTITVARILVASGEYHTFLPCAFTLVLQDAR